MKKFLYILSSTLFIALIVFIVWFAKNNSTLVSINILGSELKPYPVWFILLISFAVGVLITYFILILKIIKLYLKLDELKKAYNKIKDTKE